MLETALLEGRAQFEGIPGGGAICRRPLRAVHAGWARIQHGDTVGFDVETYLARIDCRDFLDAAILISIDYSGPNFEIARCGSRVAAFLGLEVTGLDITDPRLAALGRALRPRLLACIVSGQPIAMTLVIGGDVGRRRRGRILILPILDDQARTVHLLGVADLFDGPAALSSSPDLSTVWLTDADDILDPNIAVI